ncbi:protease [Paenibacillus harenae]|uniref:Membrane-bound ClpP family serine protease n=1 Tax=Paenibacillus harenae TaxID=306543 RepID=A0ABT9TZZ1_PAEHA|nr:protease [Paenibacillus harenae]MDQ0112955.1 membrane-bound ClpP family serine protease [Paenibacillus harenae]
METLYLACLIGGILYAIVSVIFGDWLSMALDGMLDFLTLDGHSWLQPTALIGSLTVFGGAGIMLTRYTPLSAGVILALSVLIALAAGAGVFFLYVRPMERSENSIAFSLHALSGSLAEVLVTVPAKGYGEVLVKVGAGFTNQIAASYEGVPIIAGSRVVVVEVKDHTLYVSEVDLS